MGANGFSGPDGATTEVVANGLVGSALTNFLNLLGAGPVTTLTNSVTAPGNVIDGKLSTFATFSLPVGLLGPLNLIDSVGEAVLRSEEHTSELQSLMRRSSAHFRLQKKTHLLQQLN